jgi:hypothetical protein
VVFNNHNKEDYMKLSTPKNITFWVSIVLGVLGVILAFFMTGAAVDWGVVFLIIGFILLALGVVLPGL